MDVIQLIHKALSDEDIGLILGTDAKIVRDLELRHITNMDELLTKGMDYSIILYEDRPDKGTGPPCQDTTVYRSTSIPMAISPTRRLSVLICR